MIKKIVVFGLVIVTILFIIAGISGDQTTPDKANIPTEISPSDDIENTSATTAHSAITSSCFTPHSENPVLENGSLFRDANWNDPSVIKEGDAYSMYASAAQSFDGNVKIYRLLSDDGQKWRLSPETPVLERSGDPNAWDAKSVETPSVVVFNGVYYMFYTGYNTAHTDVASYRVGYATSPDGITWTKAEDPLISPTDPKANPNLDFNQYIVGEPGAVVFNNTLYVYFTAVGAHQSVGTTLQTIGMISTTNGRTWSKPIMVISPDQETYPRTAGWVGYSTPSPTVINENIHLFYDVVTEKPSWKQVALGHAVSANGVSEWKQDKKPLFTREDFAWTSEEIRAPSALFHNNTLTLWFAGHNKKANLGIGMATCPLE